MKALREEVLREREITHKMAVQLAKYRKKEREFQASQMFEVPPIPQSSRLFEISPLETEPVKEQGEVTIMPHIHPPECDAPSEEKTKISGGVVALLSSSITHLSTKFESNPSFL